MVDARTYYLALAYGIPFGAFAIIFVFITIIHKRVDWFILHSILGLDWKDKVDDSKKSDKRPPTGKSIKNDAQTPGNNQQDKPKADDEERYISTYLFINFDDDNVEDISPLQCIVRSLSDLLASSILAIFVEIIFDALILSEQNLKFGDKCPTFDAQCFSTVGSSYVGPFNCTDGQYTNFSIDAKSLWCVGWVYQTKGINDVLDTLGTCGGLIGIISSIVPFVYYLSYYKRFYKCSITCIILPIIPVAGLCVVVWLAYPEGPSQVTYVVFSVIIAMVLIGWLSAVYRSFGCEMESNGYSDKCCCGKRIVRRACNTKCYKYCFSVLCKKYTCYPLCCIDDCSQKRSVSAPSQDVIKENSRNTQPTGQYGSPSLSPTPVSFQQSERWVKPPLQSQKPFKKVP